MFNVITDGLSILYAYKEAIFAFYITIFGIGFFITRIFRNWNIDLKTRMLASFSIGSILLSLISFIFIVLFHTFNFPLQFGSYTLFVFGLIICLKALLSGEFNQAYGIRSIIFVVGSFFLLLLRLAFLKHIILPPYSDSPIHYQIVYGFLHPEINSVSKLSLQTISENYYHYGFHSLVVWLAAFTKFEPVKLISLVGQLILVMTPLSVIFLIYAITRNGGGALYAGLLSAVGWLMPAFAVNWGKFPALASVALMPVVAALPLLLVDRRFNRMGVISYGLILLFGITFVHTRIVICLFLIFASFFIVSKLRTENEIGYIQAARFTLLFLISLWPLSHLLVDYYYKIPNLLILLILMPFAFQGYPTLSIGIFIFLSGISLTTFIPNFLDVGGQALLDRQFLEIVLYVPLSLMGGLGFGELFKKLESRYVFKWVMVVILVGCIIVNVKPLSFYPDSCCNYFKENDQLAFEWIQHNSSSNALYFTSTITENGKAYGTDAGTWIFPLMKIATNKLPYNSRWGSADILSEVCLPGKKNIYLYMGGKEFSFNNDQLSQLSWLTRVFRAGEVVIYQCK